LEFFGKVVEQDTKSGGTDEFRRRNESICNVTEVIWHKSEEYMSAFSESWEHCMHDKGLPVPSVEDANEALELVDKIHQAIENAGGEAEVTIGALIVAGALVGVDEAALAVLSEVAQVAAALYISVCIACLASVALDDLKGLFASNDLPDFVVAELEGQGVDLGGEAHA
jgi:hypothetical protein